MNPPVVRLYLLVLLLFGILVFFTSKWAVLDAEELKDKTENRRALIVEQQIPRGTYLDRGRGAARGEPPGGLG